MQNNYQRLIEELGSQRVKINEPLAQYTTFKIGGPADFFFNALSQEELAGVVKKARQFKVSYLVLGGGSNLLVGDLGFRGLVIKVGFGKVSVQKGEEVRILAEPGAILADLVETAAQSSVTGLEFLAGIPGTVGGAVRGNAGAWQQLIGEGVYRVKALNEKGEIVWLSQKDCRFDYRQSVFKNSPLVIMEVELRGQLGEQPQIREKVKEYLEKRAAQPKEPSAGCIFVNPRPRSAGALIEELGLKGAQIGGAKISLEHANFIVNTGGAKAVEVVELINLAKNKVKERFGIELKEEIVRIGEF
jgi:UDP-N-acetylmuramate dehydrogenase